MMEKKHINSKKIYLKYTNTNKTNQQIVEMLNKIIKIDDYIIGIDFDNQITHIFIENKLNIRVTVSRLNLKIDNLIFIPIIESPYNKIEIINNILKKEQVINTFNTILSDKTFSHESNYLLDLAKQKTPAEIEKLVLENHGNLFLKKGQTFLNSLKKISEHHTKQRNSTPVKYPIESFTNVPDILKKWDSQETSLIINGPSGVGKTYLALALCDKLGKKALFVSHIEKLKDLSGMPDCNAIIFDDCNFDDKTREEIIHLLDIHFDREIRILYQSVTIKSGTILIFTTNKNSLFNCEDLPEIQRRISKMFVEKPLFETKNINIQVNNVNYYNESKKKDD